MTIPTLPSAPLITDIPADFNTKAFNWVSALDNWTTEANAAGVAVDADASAAAASAGTATTQAGTATTQAGIATSAAGTATTQAGIATTKAGEADASAIASAASAASVNKDQSGGTAGLTLYKVNMKNVAGTFTSFLTNTNTAARTYTFPDADGTLYTTATGSITSAQLAASLTDETGSGVAVFATSPALVTPTLGVASATSINKVALTAPASSATLTIADGKTLTALKSISLTSADDTGVYTLPTGTKTLVATDVTALSSLASVGTITSGTWNATDIAVADGGTGRSTGTTAYALVATGTTATGAQQTLASGATTEVLVGGGASALPVWTTATGSGAPVRATAPTLVTPILGAATGTSFQGIIGNVTPAEGTFTSLTSTGNATLGDAEATDTHAIKGATTLLANSASAALTVTQTGAGNAFVVEDSASTDTTPVVIDANGRLIIGHTSSVAVLGVESGIQNWTAFGYTAQGRFTNDAFSSLVNLVKSRNTSPGGQTIVQSGDDVGAIAFTGSDGTAFIRAAQITASVDGTPGTSDMPGRLVFSTTADGASSPTERMRIDSAGNVGIGAPPGSKLYVGGVMTGAAASAGIYNAQTVFSDVTTSAWYYRTFVNTADAAFGISTGITHYSTVQSTITGGSRLAVTNQFGFEANATLIGATNNYGFYSNIAAAANRYNFFAGGSAQNKFSGDVHIFGAGGLGYATGSGGAVTQGTGRTTDVTLDKTNGAITLVSAAGTATWQSFTVTNSTVAATDTVIVSQKSGTDLNMIFVTAVAAGSFRISFATTGGTTTEQPVFNFAVIKAVAA